jgi:hypothetical protein
MTVDERALEYWRSLPPLLITMREALKLPEYSASNPTGVRPGKRWRRENGAFDHAFKREGGKPRWVICAYEDAPPERDSRTGKMVEMCAIVTYRPVIRMKGIRNGVLHQSTGHDEGTMA